MSEDESPADPDPPDPTEGDASAASASSTDRAEGDGRAPRDAEAVDVPVSAEEHVVPKRTYCRECPHLSEPPSFVCTHEGTTIVELVDGEHVRVQNCPLVGEASVEKAPEADDRNGANE